MPNSNWPAIEYQAKVIENTRPIRIKALVFTHRHRKSTEDLHLLADMLGLSDLLQETR